MARVTGGDYYSSVTSLSDWCIEEGLLRKEFTFKTFAVAMKFINQIADVVGSTWHHPDMLRTIKQRVIELLASGHASAPPVPDARLRGAPRRSKHLCR